MAEVRLDGVSKAFGGTTVLKDVDLTVADGEFVVFVGPSGCGKSTLLRLVAGLEDPTAGRVFIGGRDVTAAGPAERGVAMVFQSYALYPQMSVYENMAFALKLAKTPRAEVDRAVRAAAETLSIGHLLDRKPRALSGGQRQRVAIGRAIMRQPQAFLFDEPLSNLDADLRGRMRYEFARLRERLQTTMIYVTHDQVEAMTLADRIVVLRDGGVEQAGAPMDLYRDPASLFVAGFIGSPKMNLLPATVVDAGPAHATVRLAGGEILRAAVDGSRARPGAAATLGVRPERFALAGGANVVTAEVRFVEALGGATYAYAAAAGTETELIVQLPGDTAVRAGDRLSLEVPPAAAYLFDADGRAFPRVQG